MRRQCVYPPPSEGAGGDYEQLQPRPFYSEAGGFLQMYIMAALEPHRYQLQIVHEFDSCCFRGGGLHPNITAYNKFAQGHVKGWFQTAVTAGNYHEVSFHLLRPVVLPSNIAQGIRVLLAHCVKAF